MDASAQRRSENVLLWYCNITSLTRIIKNPSAARSIQESDFILHLEQGTYRSDCLVDYPSKQVAKLRHVLHLVDAIGAV
jgi:hypothetical protein